MKTLGTLLAVVAEWTTIAIFGPHDIAGPFLAMIFTIVIVVSAAILRVALKREPYLSVTGD